MIGDTSRPVVVTKLLLGAARTLGRLGVPVYGLHRKGYPTTRSRYLSGVLTWDVDSAPAEATVDFLLDSARRIDGRPLLLATDDVSSMVVCDHADALAEAYDFPRPPDGVARNLYSKRGMYELCRRHDVPTPDTVFPESRQEARNFAVQSGYPVVVKAIDGGLAQQRGLDRTVIAKTEQEMLEAYDEAAASSPPNVLLQQYIPGGSETVWMFDGYFDERSDSRFAAIGRKLRQYPPTTGMTSLGVCADNAEVDALTRRFMRDIGYRGVLDCGYRWDSRDGLYKLLDVNPRIGATFRLFVGEKGLDVVRALYLDMTGQPVPADAARPGRKWLAEDFDLMTLATVMASNNGSLGIRRWAGSLRGVDETAWFSRDDLRPFLGMTRELVAKGLRRASGTKGA
jgi:D-aspartate ligase